MERYYIKYIYIYHWDQEEPPTGKKVQGKCSTHSTLHSYGKQAHAELYTRADTSCGGKNVWLHKMTVQICSVSLSSASYNPMQDVQIATCLTAYTDEYIRTLILVFNELLWFRTGMDHSLIIPSQIQMAGIPVSDDPFDEN